MSKKLAIITACLMAGVTPALAQNATCVEPTPVANMVNGNTATAQELLAVRSQVMEFMSRSEIYQTCIASDLDAKRKAAAAAGATFDNQHQQVALAKINANQLAKDRLARELNDQIVAFKKRPPAN